MVDNKFTFPLFYNSEASGAVISNPTELNGMLHNANLCNRIKHARPDIKCSSFPYMPVFSFFVLLDLPL